MDIGVGTIPSCDSETQTTRPPSAAFTILSRANCLVESELAVDRQNKQRVEFSCAHQFRDVCNVDKKECLEQLRDNLVRADEQHHFPLRPIPNVIDIPKDDAEKNDLPAEPKNLNHHPKQ